MNWSQLLLLQWWTIIENAIPVAIETDDGACLFSGFWDIQHIAGCVNLPILLSFAIGQEKHDFSTLAVWNFSVTKMGVSR